jgi:uncharacterized protein YkwD
MARLRPGLAVLAAITLTLLACASALGASRSVRHLARCSHSVRAGARRGHVGSVRVSHPPTSSRGVRRCQRRHTTSRRRQPARRPAPRRTLSSAADNGVCADAELGPTRDDVELVRAATLCLVNRERAAHGEAALRPNGQLEAAAQRHTESMAFGDYFEHIGPGGQTPLDRMRTAGYIYSSSIGYAVGENIAWGTGYLATPRAIVASWMGSSGHRANILEARYRDTAIGVSPHPPTSLAHGQAGGIYTQDFGVIIG